MRMSLQSRCACEIKEDMDVVAWMVAEAAESINRFQIGPDGKTRRERVTGKKWHRQTAEFCETVHYMKLKTKGKYTWSERWSEGLWLGVREESGEIIIGTTECVVKARTFERIASHDERWNAERIEEFIQRHAVGARARKT